MCNKCHVICIISQLQTYNNLYCFHLLYVISNHLLFYEIAKKTNIHLVPLIINYVNIISIIITLITKLYKIYFYRYNQPFIRSSIYQLPFKQMHVAKTLQTKYQQPRAVKLKLG